MLLYCSTCANVKLVNGACTMCSHGDLPPHIKMYPIDKLIAHGGIESAYVLHV
jgi:hypothetical protein